MRTFGKEQFLVLVHFSVLFSLSGCGGAELECDSLESRNSVVRIIADDNNNVLVNYAANNSSVVAVMVGNANVQADKLAILETAKRGAVYKLDDTIHMRTRDRAARAVTCSGALDVTVAETTAQKAVEFSVTQTRDGKMLVSVDPFLFEVLH
jgi:hypothetical protein